MRYFDVIRGWFRSFQWLIACIAIVSACSRSFAAQAEEDDAKLDPKAQHARELLKSIDWQAGPVTAKLGTIAEIKVPKGFLFTGQAGAAKWAELNENIPNSSQLGVLMPKDHTDWFIVFNYEDSGHVPDDEKGTLDATAILKTLREGNDEENAERKRRNWAPMELAGWQIEPAYDPETHYLVWGLRVSSEGQETINYNTKMLGRTGVMSANLVVSPAKFQSAIGPSKKLLADYQFTNGSKYSEWRAGDKVAQYGLTGLITGGVLVAAAKSGLLAKLGVVIAAFAKYILIGCAALAATVAKFFRAIFGGGKSRSNS
jgi:uncharacterized membrane-anchored protein